jgi:Raf kinase inhibitor-like YbhB/YbcL family protein
MVDTLIRRTTWARGLQLAWLLPLGAAALVACGCQGNQSLSKSGVEPMKITVTSTAFQEGETIPKQYTKDSKDVSPPLKWDSAPDGTKSFALICDDPDAPRGTWVHWVLFNLPADTRSLEEGVPTSETLPNGARQGKNDFGDVGYGGPKPPPGKRHRYFFKLYALDAALDLQSGATKAQVEGKMKGHVIGDGQLMGKYAR